jgi:putative tryptophan/tyrosine transport system substrate-binding protein
MFNPDTAPYSKFLMPVIESAATSLGVQFIPAPVRTEADIELALAVSARQPNAGLMLQGDSFTRLHQKLIANLAVRFSVPSIASSTDFANDGGLMEYGRSPE